MGDEQGGLACCRPWGHKELDTTERLNWTELSSLQWWQFSFLRVSFYLFPPKSTWHLCSSHCLLNDLTASADVFKSFQHQHAMGSLHLAMLGSSLVDLSFLEWLCICFCWLPRLHGFDGFDILHLIANSAQGKSQPHVFRGICTPLPGSFYLNLIPGGSSPENLSTHWAGEQFF